MANWHYINIKIILFNQSYRNQSYRKCIQFRSWLSKIRIFVSSLFCCWYFLSTTFVTASHWISLRFLLILILKSDSHLVKTIFFISLNESPLKKMKNNLYLILKALFVHKMFKLLSGLSGHTEKNGLIRKISLILNIMTSQAG